MVRGWIAGHDAVDMVVVEAFDQDEIRAGRQPSPDGMPTLCRVQVAVQYDQVNAQASEGVDDLMGGELL
jgi:hypothetical protein